MLDLAAHITKFPPFLPVSQFPPAADEGVTALMAAQHCLPSNALEGSQGRALHRETSVFSNLKDKWRNFS